jgi:hypothetical protein
MQPTRRSLAGLALLVTFAVAGCGTPRAARTSAATTSTEATTTSSDGGFVLTFRSGEASEAAQSTTSTWTFANGRLSVAVRYEGRDAGQPGREPQDADGDVGDAAAVLAQADAAAAIVPANAAAPALVDVTYREICLQRAGARHCAWQVGDAPADDGFRALASLETRLTTYVILGP